MEEGEPCATREVDDGAFQLDGAGGHLKAGRYSGGELFEHRLNLSPNDGV